MRYSLDKLAYARWYRERFKAPPDADLISVESTVILELEGTSKLSSRDQAVVHVRVAAGSVGVSLGMEFAVAQTCLKPYQGRTAVRP